MTSPIPTRNRAILCLAPARSLFCDAQETDATQLRGLFKREPLFLVDFLSTGPRLSMDANFDTVRVDFWEKNSQVNGPHCSRDVVVAAHWPSNLLLCVCVRSIRINGIISIHSTCLDDQISTYQYTINDVHLYFSMQKDELDQLLNESADLNRASGGHQHVS